MHGHLTDEIARYEKYRHGHDFITELTWPQGPETKLMAERFGYWFAQSDWDDMVAGFNEWSELEEVNSG